MWEAGVRVPLMIVGPGIEAGSYTRTPAIGWDILPTICDIVGVKELDDQVEGGSLLPVLLRQPEASVLRPREELYFTGLITSMKRRANQTPPLFPRTTNYTTSGI